MPPASDFNALQPPTPTSQGGRRVAKRRSRKFWWWLAPLIVILLIAVAGATIAALSVPRGLAARDALETAIPLANQAKQQIIAGDSDAAKSTIGELRVLTADARAETDYGLWKSLEWVPVAGPNLHAVRIAAESVDDLVLEVVDPLSALNIEALKPRDGAIDVVALEELHTLVAHADIALQEVEENLVSVDRDALINQVAGGITKLNSALEDVNGIIEPASQVLAVLPEALGADGPRKYLVMFQNNAESRGTGGNPAALVVLNIDNGRMEITEQASSGDFNNGRPSMITDVDPETVALYGDKIGRWMQDVTLTPDFSETADIMLAFWEDSFGTPIDAVASFDPVALSYLLEATGPVQLDTGQTLTAENSVSLLLNDVYADYPDPAMQDLFFAAAASSAFSAITSGGGDTMQLVDAITRAVDEGRLMYAPANDDEAALIAGTRITGQLPVDNAEDTVLGVYVNDITEGKLNYYMDLDITAESNQCNVDTPEFTVSTDIHSILQPDEVWGLASYISPGRFFPKGDISTDLVVYGPVGGTFSSATVDGNAVSAKPLTHLGRPAVKINVLNHPASTHNVTVTFTGKAGEYGELDVWHTPMVRETPVEVTTPGC